MRTFCAKCGRRESPDSPLIQGLCAECFTNTKKIVQLPDYVDVTRCGICGAIRSREGKFSRVSLSEYVKSLAEGYVAREKIAEGVNQVVIDRVELQDSEAVVEVRGVAGGVIVHQVLRVRVTVENTVCPECYRYRTKSFEAVVQLRPGNSRAFTLVSKIASEVYKYPGIVDIKESKEGVDLYIAEKSTAMRIVKDLESSYITKVLSTWKGFKYAHRKPKAVFSVRVFEVDEGDLIELRDGLYEVVEANPRAVVLRNTRTGEVLSLTLNDLWRKNPTFLERD